MAFRSPPKAPDATDTTVPNSGDPELADVRRQQRFEKTSAWIGNLQGAYNAGRSGDLASTLGSVSTSIISVVGVGGALGWATGVGAVVMAAYGINRANREADEQQRQAAKRTVALEPGAPIAVPLLYGYFRTGPNLSLIHI